MTPSEQEGFIEELEHEPPEHLWYVEFRAFSTLDYLRPLMDIPVQRTYVWAISPDEAKRQIWGWCTAADLRFSVVERAPEWMQKR